MDRGLFPTYYMHLERDDNKKVLEAAHIILAIVLLPKKCVWCKGELLIRNL